MLLRLHSESYDSFGEVTGFVQDLADVAERRRDAQRVRVSVDEADVHLQGLLNAPPSVVWQDWRPYAGVEVFGVVHASTP